MARITNLFNCVGGSEVPGAVKLHLINGRLNYIVLGRFEQPNERLASSQLKHGRSLKSLNDKLWKNSGLPESRKRRGNGELVVRSFSSISFLKKLKQRKGFSKLVVEESALSGVYESTKLKELIKNVKSNSKNKIQGLTEIMSDPQFLIAS